MSPRKPRRAPLSDTTPNASTKNPSIQSRSKSASPAPATRHSPGTPLGATRSPSRYKVLPIASTACAPVTEHQASANAVALARVPRTPGSVARTVDTSRATAFAMAGGSPLTSSASPGVCIAAPISPSQSVTDRNTPSVTPLVVRSAVSSLVNNTGSLRYTQCATDPKSFAVWYSRTSIPRAWPFRPRDSTDYLRRATPLLEKCGIQPPSALLTGGRVPRGCDDPPGARHAQHFALVPPLAGRDCACGRPVDRPGRQRRRPTSER